MPPRKMGAAQMQQPNAAKTLAKPAVPGKIVSPVETEKELVEVAPPIDYAALIQELLEESNQKIADALQARQEQLMEKMGRADGGLNQPPGKRKP